MNKRKYHILFFLGTFIGGTVIGAVLYSTRPVEPVSNAALATILKSVGGNEVACPEVAPELLEETKQGLGTSSLASTALEDTNESILSIEGEIEALAEINQPTTIRVAKERLQTLVQKRKTSFVAAMRENPEEALLHALGNEQNIAAQSVSKGCIETPRIVEGTFEVIHADGTDGHTSYLQYAVATSAKKRVVVHPAGALSKQIKPGSKVQVAGYGFDNEIVFDASKETADTKAGESGITVLTSPATASVNLDEKVAILRVKFANQTSAAPSEAQVGAHFQNALQYLKDVSYGKVTLTADIYGPYTLAVPADPCDAMRIIDYASRAADADINYADYSRVLMIAPSFSCSSFAGFAMVGSVLNIDDEALVPYSFAATTLSLPITAHELGHSLGASHATFFKCTSLCTSPFAEYGDIYTAMGEPSLLGDFNALHKELLSWFAPSEIQTVSSNGNFTIQPIESNTPGGIKALKIPRFGGSMIYVEYRQPIGRDMRFQNPSSFYPQGTDVFEGALLHIVNGYSAKSGMIDPTPFPTPSAASAALKVGDIFTDPVNGTRIKVLSKSPSGLTVNVQLGTLGKISVNITKPSASQVLTNPKTILVEATATSPIGNIKEVAFAIDSMQKVVGVDKAKPYRKSINVRTLTPGKHWLYVIAKDKFGNSSLDRVRIEIVR